MNRTSKSMKSWKEEMVKRWVKLVLFYQKAKSSPSFKRWGKVLLEVGKILCSVLLKKAVDFLFRNF